MTVRQIIDAWNCFWFTAASVLPLSLLRIGFGIIMLIWCALLLPEIGTFYGAHRIVPGATADLWYGDSALDILAVLPHTDASALALLAVTFVAALFVTIGLCTRLSAFVLLLGLSSFANACPLIMHSGDTLSRVLAVLLVFAPSNKMLSCDALIRRSLKKTPATDEVGEFGDPVHAQWVIRLLQLQVAAVYYQSFWSKLQGPMWLDGTAVYYTSRLLEFKRFALPYIFDQLWTIHALTWGTLAIEFSLFTLIWIKELRYWVLLAAICMHLTIDLTMNIPLFEWIMMVCYLSFVDGRDIHRAMAFIRRRLPGAAVSPPSRCAQ